MKIISDYWDYFYHIQTYGGETQDVLFLNRKPKYGSQVSTNIEDISINMQSSHMRGYLHIVGFCGVLYPLLVRYPKRKDTWGFNRYYYPDDHNDYAIPDNAKRIYDLKKIVSLDDGYWKKDITNFLSMIVIQKKLLDIFTDKKVPLFVAREIRAKNHGDVAFEINYAPMLSKYHFDKIFDSQQAFQEIEYYMSNVLNRRENPDPQITDNIILRDNHGFDKFSFKKLPSKKR